ncbi:MAG: acetate--CoA ligase family protein [Variovorax sp.]|nr:acetate--CoA ligase family protein [Variovorax sp.]
MPAQSLDPLFCPSSIAVIGASSDPRKIGGRPIAYMLRSGYAGQLLPINPKQEEVQGLKAYASLADVGHPVDQVIVAVSGALVERAVEEALEQRARSIVIFSSGFGETGHDGKLAQERLAARCRDAGVHLVGPNCIGIFSSRNAMYSTFMSALEHEIFEPGQVGIVSQSGAVGSYLYGLAGDRGVRFSHFVATGNEAGVDVADCIEWMAHDDNTRVILTYLEGCGDGQRLRRALETARARRKPVVVMKVGASEQGAAAAASHTGSLAGADVVFDTIFKEGGAWRAQTLEELVDVGYACAISVLPQGNRLGVITPSGGIGVIAADECERSGLVLPHLPQAQQDQIKEIVPFASGTNPVDTTGQVVSDRKLFNRIMKIVFDFDGFDSVLSFNANIGKTEIEWSKVRDDLLELRRQYPRKLVALSMRSRPEVVKELEDNHILYFPDPALATRTIGALAWIAQAQRAAPSPRIAVAGATAAEALPVGDIDEAGARGILARAGVPFAPQHVANSAAEAARAAAQMGFPVVIKVLSPDIAHKSDVGGVVLNLRSEEAVRGAWDAMMAKVSANCPDARIQGAVVSPMITGGVETVLGMVNDPVFGPMMMFGLGGIFVEIFKDVTFHSAPLDLAQAQAMIRAIKGVPLLDGARGKAPVDLDALAQALVRLSEFVAAHADSLASVEINPFIALPEGGYAVDALIIRK